VQFGGVKPINELTATLAAPIAGLIGPNGAGKTTLLNVLSGFVRPARGSVALNGEQLLDLAPLQRVRAGLRRSFQTEQVVED
ncbi:ATP-binding cassette domain-containing protein, partial [Rhizobium ruizarguesonis]